MIILSDTRQQVSKHDLKEKFFADNGITVKRTKLYVGDYTLPTNQKIAVDTKKDIQELIGNLCSKQHERFREECDRAVEIGAELIILVENKDGITCVDDLYKWENPRLDIFTNTKEVIGMHKNGYPRYKKARKYPRATTGVTLAKTIMSTELKHGVKFMFCHPNQSGPIILELLGIKL